MNWFLVVRLIQVISAGCGIWSFWNGAALRDRMMLGESTQVWEWLASMGPMVLAGALWLGANYLGVRVGLRSELFLAMVAWLRGPRDRASERRLVLAALDFLVERAAGNEAMQKLLADLADLLQQHWYPTIGHAEVMTATMGKRERI